jgi:hypothetical protein
MASFRILNRPKGLVQDTPDGTCVALTVIGRLANSPVMIDTMSLDALTSRTLLSTLPDGLFPEIPR